MGILNMNFKKTKSSFEYNKTLALAGNPNVGKSTVFNSLTGLKQHTGNWPGKTVSSAEGVFSFGKNSYLLVDTPGTYSLMAQSIDEEVARNFICFGKNDAVIIVCDATCLQRNLNLALQILEAGKRAVICLNLMDEADRKRIKINVKALSGMLKIPVIPTTAKDKKSLIPLMKAIENISDNSIETIISYPAEIETLIKEISNILPDKLCTKHPKRWISLKLLENNSSLLKELKNSLETADEQNLLAEAILKTELILKNHEITYESVNDTVTKQILLTAEEIAEKSISYDEKKYCERDRKTDKVLCSRKFGYPIMLLLLSLVFYITIWGANYPSTALSTFLFKIQVLLEKAFVFLHAPDWLSGILIHGMYRTLSWVVSVMLPPMAIFFPIFTLLEDSGYLPRIAYCLDNSFKKCCACGKQALTMCMGFGCNAAGVIGCRIITSPRERLLAIITNSFVPCNGRFPALISLITIFLASVSAGFFSVPLSAIILTGFIFLSVVMTFAATKILSKTLLKGTPSSFTLELPPYRKPQIGSVIVRSIFDRTWFVLKRSALVAAPAGIFLWVLANIRLGDLTILKYITLYFEPLGKMMGLDGVILTAFILGLPANEIVLPIAVMSYTSQGVLSPITSLTEMYNLLVSNGWTVLTALNFILFSIFHWPCSTTLITIKKETGSFKWTAISAILPTFFGIFLCIISKIVFTFFL